jgi:hypothetical protein
MSILRYACLGSLMLALAAASPARGQDAGGRSNDAPPKHESPLDDLTRWLESHFSEAERKALRSGDLEFQSVYCGCYDKPVKHFPYAIALVKTPKGDLLLRPERTEGGTIYTAIATRFGERYCGVESESECYGTFVDLCAFTDYRFGPTLVAYFPTCKSDDAEEEQ